MKLSAVLVGLVRDEAVTVTLTVEAAWAGATALITCEDSTWTTGAATLQKWTVAPLVNPIPVRVTIVPPAVVPLVGEMEATTGNSAVTRLKANLLAPERLLLPAEVMTVTPTVAACSAGEIAAINVEEITRKLSALAAPKSTALVPMNPVPAIITLVPPAVEPLEGLTSVTTALVPEKAGVHWAAKQWVEAALERQAPSLEGTIELKSWPANPPRLGTLIKELGAQKGVCAASGALVTFGAAPAFAAGAAAALTF